MLCRAKTMGMNVLSAVMFFSVTFPSGRQWMTEMLKHEKAS